VGSFVTINSLKTESYTSKEPMSKILFPNYRQQSRVHYTSKSVNGGRETGSVYCKKKARNAEKHFVDREFCNTAGRCVYSYCWAQARNIKYSEFVFVAIVIQHANRMRCYI